MASSLISGANSDYINAGNVIRGGGKVPEIYVYVEGLDDICFWNELLKQYSQGRKFIITQLRNADNSIAEGKGNLIRTIGLDTLGVCKYIAVDADYDWLIDNYRTSQAGSSVSEDIRNNPFILHTYLYSIENFKCHPRCVDSFVSKATCCVNNIDAQAIFSNISYRSARLFLIHIASAHNCDGVYTLKQFRQDMNNINIKENGKLSDASLKYLNSREKELAEYESINSELINFYRNKLSDTGFSPEEYHHFFQGHIVANTLTKKLFTPFILRLRVKMLNDLRTNPIESQAHDKVSQYEKITGISAENDNTEISSRIDQLIFDCTDIRFAEKGFKMIEEHLKRRFG
ncbi:MAG: DUF4435 domain-containing protein [Muribaculaceae bacterium]|nr:DUF4435 domain-containing protein [Muribaculaceae bacterium]